MKLNWTKPTIKLKRLDQIHPAMAKIRNQPGDTNSKMSLCTNVINLLTTAKHNIYALQEGSSYKN